MWEKGTVNVGGAVYAYHAKVYEVGSKFGIDGGRVSKLEMARDGETVCSYDRGWDVEPEGEMDIEALDHVLCFYE